MLPALPTGRQCTSGASPSASTISNAAVFCPSIRDRVHAVDQRDRVVLGQVAGEGQAVVEVALRPGAAGRRGRAPATSCRGRSCPRAPARAQTIPAADRVRRRRRAGVAGRRADDRLRARPRPPCEIASVMPRSLNDPVGLAPSHLQVDVAAGDARTASARAPAACRPRAGSRPACRAETGSRSRYSSITPRHWCVRARRRRHRAHSPSTRMTDCDRADDVQRRAGRRRRRTAPRRWPCA